MRIKSSFIEVISQTCFKVELTVLAVEIPKSLRLRMARRRDRGLG
jgi:hypothetical protein